ncbi:DUF3370 domain-containing protein [Synechococcus sp. UW140]|jgi:hypothetical protein|uniref:DUF3370 domain-containing protein n=2 Tax=Synechococcus TaxID=1129 RepID=UPI0023558320|nr:DUF3370 domain-containing protein [Synechococcus sp. UW140]
MKLMMKLKMKLTFWPAVLGALLFETLILPNQAQAQTEQFRAGVVRALPGQLDRGLMINDNNPEVVKGAGILLSTFDGKNRPVPDAHLNLPLDGSFELFSHHIFAGVGPNPNSTLWLGIVLGNRTNRAITIRMPSGASWLSQPDAPFLPLPHQLEHDGLSVYAGPGSRAAGDLIAGAPRPSWLPASITLPPNSSQLAFSLPIPVKGLDPLLNGRNLQVRFESDGPVALASLALIGDNPPSPEQWLALLDGGLSEKEHVPTPKGAPGPIIYSRVSGVQQGRRWKGVLSDPGSKVLQIGDQPVSWPIASLQKGTFGTGQVQSAQLLAYYPNTAWEAHGNYGVEYDLDLPLRNGGKQTQQLALSLESPLKSDRKEGGLRFRNPPGPAIFFRGSVELRGLDGNPGRKYLHLVLRQGDLGKPLGFVTLAAGEQRNVRLRLIVPADITPVQVLTVTPLAVKQSEPVPVN